MRYHADRPECGRLAVIRVDRGVRQISLICTPGPMVTLSSASVQNGGDARGVDRSLGPGAVTLSESRTWLKAGLRSARRSELAVAVGGWLRYLPALAAAPSPGGQVRVLLIYGAHWGSHQWGLPPGLGGHRRVAGAGSGHPRRLNMFRSCLPGRGSAGQDRARAQGAGVEGDVCHAAATATMIGQIRPGLRA